MDHLLKQKPSINTEQVDCPSVHSDLAIQSY